VLKNILGFRVVKISPRKKEIEIEHCTDCPFYKIYVSHAGLIKTCSRKVFLENRTDYSTEPIPANCDLRLSPVTIKIK
jgi:hypothetical protein